MKIKFTDSVAGARFAYRTGEVVDLPDAVAREFLQARQAVQHDVEEAVVAAPENATKRRGGSRGRGLFGAH